MTTIEQANPGVQPGERPPRAPTDQHSVENAPAGEVPAENRAEGEFFREKRQTGRAEKRLPMAVILAGGFGKRLRPLTDFLPKPLLPVGGEPMIGRIIDNLEREGVRKALILTGYKGELIEKALSGRAGAIELLWQDERRPVGSAGCVKRARELLEDEFFVVCADIYGERGYRAFYDFYREKEARAAMLVTRVREPGEYGIVQADASGRVRAFAEKPQWGRVFSDRANAGVYLISKDLIDLIPDGKPFDFGGQFFPLLLERHIGVYAFDDGGLWRDVGDFSSYLAVNLAENGGKSVLMPDVLTARGAQIADSLLFEGVRVGENARVEGSIVDKNCSIGASCEIPSGCVLGRNTVLCDGVCLPPGTFLSPGSMIGKSPARSSEPDGKTLFSAPSALLLQDLTDGFLCDLGAAAARASGKGRVGVFYTGEENRAAAREALEGVCTVCAGEDCGEALPGQVGLFLCRTGLDCALHIGVAEGGRTLTLFDGAGLQPSSAFLRKMRDEWNDLRASRAARAGKDDGDPPRSTFVPLRREAETRAFCERALSRACPAVLSGVSVGVGFAHPAAAVLSHFLLSRGARVCERGKGDFNVLLTPDGRRAHLADATGELDHWHLCALLLSEELRGATSSSDGAREEPSAGAVGNAEPGESFNAAPHGERSAVGRTVALPYRAPRVLFDLVRGAGAQPVGYPLCPESDGGVEGERRRRAYDLPFLFDGVYAVAAGLSCVLTRKTTVRALYESLPPFAVFEERFDCAEEEKLPLLLDGGYLPAGEGLDRHIGRARVAIRAAEKRGIDVMIEAAREEDCAALYARAKREFEERRK